MSNENESTGEKPNQGMERLRAQKFFWFMFRLRLVLLALILPIVIMIADEMVSAFLLDRTLYLTGVFLQLGLRLIIMLLGLCLVVKFLTGTSCWPFTWTVLPLLGLFRDLCQLPTIWIARQIEAFACRGTSKRKWSLSPGTAVTEMVVFTALFAGSFATCHPLYHAWAERNRSLKAQNEQRTEFDRSMIDPSQIERYEYTRDLHETDLSANETIEDILQMLENYRNYLEEELDSKPLKQEIFKAITAAEETLQGRAKNERLDYYWYSDWCQT